MRLNFYIQTLFFVIILAVFSVAIPALGDDSLVKSTVKSESQNKSQKVSQNLAQVSAPTSSVVYTLNNSLFSGFFGFAKTVGGALKNGYSNTVEATTNLIQPLFNRDNSVVNSSSQNSKNSTSRNANKNASNTSSTFSKVGTSSFVSSLVSPDIFSLITGKNNFYGNKDGVNANSDSGSDSSANSETRIIYVNATPTLSDSFDDSGSSKTVIQTTAVDRYLIQSILARLERVEETPRTIVNNISNTYSGTSSGGGISASSFNSLADSVSRALDEFRRGSIEPAISSATASLTTTNVSEGSNLYFTDSRADARADLRFAENLGLATSTIQAMVPSTSISTSTIRGMFSSNESTLLYNNSTGVFELAAGYNIPLTASTTEWSAKISSPWRMAGSNNIYSASSTAPISGSNNFFFGNEVGGAGLSTGDSNFFAGAQSGYSNTSGYNNIGIGTATLVNNTVGSGNIAMGYFAGRSIDSGHDNIFTGNQAGYSTNIGYENIMSGTSAGYSNTSGTYNVFLGYGAGDTNIDGSYNIVIGKNADVGSASLINAVAIGHFAVADRSNSIILGGTGGYAVNVGIGTSTPDSTLSVVGSGSFTGNVTANAFYGDGSNLTGITSFSTSTTRSVFSSSATGLTYTNSTGDFSLTSGYNIPLTASTTE